MASKYFSMLTILLQGILNISNIVLQVIHERITGKRLPTCAKGIQHSVQKHNIMDLWWLNRQNSLTVLTLKAKSRGKLEGQLCETMVLSIQILLCAYMDYVQGFHLSPSGLQ